MGAPDILQHLAAAGVKLTRNGGNLIAGPRSAVTPDVVQLIRQHKPELLEALTNQLAHVPAAIPTDAEAECDADLATEAGARRQRLLAMLERNSEARYAVITANDGSGPVIVAIAIRGEATAELEIERDQYDGVRMLELLEKRSRAET